MSVPSLSLIITSPSENVVATPNIYLSLNKSTRFSLAFNDTSPLSPIASPRGEENSIPLSISELKALSKEKLNAMEKAATDGDLVNAVNLAHYYYYCEGQYHKAFDLLKNIPNTEVPRKQEIFLQAAQYLRGECFENGNGVTQDLKAAFEQYQLAAAQGYESAGHNEMVADALLAVGRCCEEGIGTDPDLEKAYDAYLRVKVGGETQELIAEARIRMGRFYLFGLNGPEDCNEAENSFRAAMQLDPLSIRAKFYVAIVLMARATTETKPEDDGKKRTEESNQLLDEIAAQIQKQYPVNSILAEGLFTIGKEFSTNQCNSLAKKCLLKATQYSIQSPGEQSIPISSFATSNSKLAWHPTLESKLSSEHLEVSASKIPESRSLSGGNEGSSLQSNHYSSPSPINDFEVEDELFPMYIPDLKALSEEELSAMKQASSNGSVIDSVNLAYYYYYIQQDYAHAFQLCQKIANDNNPITLAIHKQPALHVLGQCYEFGHGVAQNFKAAYFHYHLAGFSGYQPRQLTETVADALLSLGRCLEKGIGIKQNLDCAFLTYSRVYQDIKLRSEIRSEAMIKIGRCFLLGIGTKIDHTEALECFKIALELYPTYTSAKFYLSIAYISLGIKNGDEKATEYGQTLFQELAEQEMQDPAHPDVSAGLCELGEELLRVEENHLLALDCFSKAENFKESSVYRDAKFGLAYCLQQLANSVNEKENSENYTSLAIIHYHSLVKLGHAAAECNLGDIYFRTTFTSPHYPGIRPLEPNLPAEEQPNYKMAVKLFRKASKKGILSAQYNLAICYEVGYGVKHCPNHAFKYYFAAAKKGHPWALYKIAESLQNGKWTRKNETLALDFYRIAAKRKVRDAMLFLAEQYKIQTTQKGTYNSAIYALSMIDADKAEVLKDDSSFRTISPLDLLPNVQNLNLTPTHQDPGDVKVRTEHSTALSVSTSSYRSEPTLSLQISTRSTPTERSPGSSTIYSVTPRSCYSLLTTRSLTSKSSKTPMNTVVQLNPSSAASLSISLTPAASMTTLGSMTTPSSMTSQWRPLVETDSLATHINTILSDAQATPTNSVYSDSIRTRIETLLAKMASPIGQLDLSTPIGYQSVSEPDTSFRPSQLLLPSFNNLNNSSSPTTDNNATNASRDSHDSKEEMGTNTTAGTTELRG